MWRLIEDSEQRIDGLRAELPQQLQHEILGAHMAAEKRRRLLDTDPGLTSPDSITRLEDSRAEMLLRELFLREALHGEKERRAKEQPKVAV
jgi:hypothetical protein